MKRTTTPRTFYTFLMGCAFGLTIVAGIPISSAQAQLYGTGADGSHVVVGTEHLASNKNYINLTVNPGSVLETHGFDVRVNGTLVNQGTIRDNFTGGSGGSGGNNGFGGNGGFGTTGNNGGSGFSGPAGTGVGGNGGGGGGGGGGARYNPLIGSDLTVSGGHGGDGGTGGRGGGNVVIYAREIINTGSITAAGLPGLNAQQGFTGGYRSYTEALLSRDIAGGGGGGGGGGNGGGGGTVSLTYAIPTFVGSVVAPGGSGGSGAFGGSGRNTLYSASTGATEYTGGSGGPFDANGGTGGRGEYSSVSSQSGATGQNGFNGSSGTVSFFPSVVCYVDADGDGFGDPGGPSFDVIGGCGPGFSLNNLDCDDGDAGVNPNATEVCNGIDDDCNTLIDEGLVFTTWYEDADGDGFGDGGTDSTTCDGAPAGYVADNTDCDDGDAGVNPNASEICNGIDDDCNTFVDDGLVFSTWYEDADGDGFGASGTDSTTCDGAPAGYVSNDIDCDDNEAAAFPGAVEICDGIDNDCNSLVDDGLVFTTYYVDADSDGYGASGTDSITCDGPPAGYADNDSDCDDGESSVNPGAVEICFNGVDDNCDTQIDENCCPITMTGDVNLSTTLTSADIIYLVNFVFKSGPDPMPCPAMGDVNCSGTVTSADIIYMVNHVFKSGPLPCDVCTLVPGTWTCP